MIEDTACKVRASPPRRPVVFVRILLTPETLRRLGRSSRPRCHRVRRFVPFPTMSVSKPSDDARPPSHPSNATPPSPFVPQRRQPPVFIRLKTAFVRFYNLRFHVSPPLRPSQHFPAQNGQPNNLLLSLSAFLPFTSSTAAFKLRIRQLLAYRDDTLVSDLRFVPKQSNISYHIVAFLCIYAH